ncbi:uncharacterized protein [Haliotis asinina]|uniref:uncharacterized protein n=1 Tax=Haliotis asinina TaxID=109174 RepID=UPI003531EDA4
MPSMKICHTDDKANGKLVDCVPAAGIPLFVVIITLVLCALLLATIALIIVILVFRRRKKSDAMTPDGEHHIEYSELGKPLTTAMEVQPELRSLEPRMDPRDRANMLQYGHLGPRKFLQLPLDAQRRLITVPEEDSGMEERDVESPDVMIEHIPQAELEAELDFDFEGQYEESAESDTGATQRELAENDLCNN